MTDRDEAALIAAYRDGMTMQAAADSVGVSLYVARWTLRRAGVEIRDVASYRKPTDEMIEQAVSAYVDDLMSIDNAARIAKVTGSAMRAILVERGVVIRPRGTVRRLVLTSDQLADSIKLYEDGVAIARIGELIDSIGTSAIQRAFREAGVTARRRGAAHRGPGEFGRYANGLGYILVGLLPEHPQYPMANAQDYLLQHRLVMAAALGRMLSPRETVHHIDGDRGNNELVNLQLRSGHHGQGVVLQCHSCGSHNVGPVPLPVEVSRV